MKMTIGKRFCFESGHFLPNPDVFGECANYHGHSYKLTVEVSGTPDEHGLLVNFKELKKIVENKIINKFDHATLNDFIPIPTAENTVLKIYNILKSEMPENLTLESVILYETEDSYAKLTR